MSKEEFPAEMWRFVEDDKPEICKTPPMSITVFSMGKVQRYFRAPPCFQLDKFVQFVHDGHSTFNVTSDRSGVGVTVVTKKGVCISYRGNYDQVER